MTAAIVATLAYVPLGLVMLLVLRLGGVAFETVATFGGYFALFPGLAIWWLLAYAGALVYVACLFPWGDEVLAWPRKK